MKLGKVIILTINWHNFGKEADVIHGFHFSVAGDCGITHGTYIYLGVFSTVPSVPLLAFLFLCSLPPLFPSPRSGPSNTAKGFGATLFATRGGPTFAASRHISGALTIPKMRLRPIAGRRLNLSVLIAHRTRLMAAITPSSFC